MAQKLSNIFFLALVFVFTATSALAQEPEERYSDKDYKDKGQFEKFHRRSKQVAAWQISRLKEGALVVRLKTNQLLINGLMKAGNTRMAKEKELETAAINLNTIRAYLFNYTFSKVYFIYSSSSDSLLNGARSNIFVDSSLKINPGITMTESFYLIAERDYAYNSSIGFIPEDSARYVREKGYGVKEMAVVVKNKYGHQLKKPFPYTASDRPAPKIESGRVAIITLYGKALPFNIGSFGSSHKKNKGPDVTVNYGGEQLTLSIPKYLTSDRLSISISNFNEALKNFYRAGAFAGVANDPSVKPFLY